MTSPDPRPLTPFDPWKDFDTDAQHWAEAFMAIWHDASPDEGAMLSWFANAIEVTRYAERAPREGDGLREDCGTCRWIRAIIEAHGDAHVIDGKPEEAPRD